MVHPADTIMISLWSYLHLCLIPVDWECTGYTAGNLFFLFDWLIDQNHWYPASQQKRNNIWQLKRFKIIGRICQCQSDWRSGSCSVVKWSVILIIGFGVFSEHFRNFSSLFFLYNYWIPTVTGLPFHILILQATQA